MSKSSLRVLDVERSLGDPALKQRYVTTMFDLVAPSYDRFTRWFSYGMDRGWKAELVAEAAARAPGRATVLDAACGTGDVALALSHALRGRDTRVMGLDPSPGMLANRRDSPGVTYVRGDLMALPSPGGSVDVVTAAYAFRNVPDHRAALAEVARVLVPGGVLLSLDFYRPEAEWWRRLFLHYLRLAGNLYGWMWHGEAEAYGYIARSIAKYVTATQFVDDLGGAGFVVEMVRRKLGGGICLHVARKRA